MLARSLPDTDLAYFDSIHQDPLNVEGSHKDSTEALTDDETSDSRTNAWLLSSLTMCADEGEEGVGEQIGRDTYQWCQIGTQIRPDLH